MEHDAYILRVFSQWALGWHEAWAYGPESVKGVGVMGHTVGSKFRA